jgi:hypothetical protein
MLLLFRVSLFHLHDLLSSLLSTDGLDRTLLPSIASVVLLLRTVPALAVLALTVLLICNLLAVSTN